METKVKCPNCNGLSRWEDPDEGQYVTCVRCGGTGSIMVSAPKRVLESVDDYNARKAQERKEREEKESLTGVACPNCGAELRWAEHPLASLMMSRPAKRRAGCKPCGLSVDLVV